jgi:hypothetical protein
MQQNIQQWAKAHDLDTNKVVSAVKKLVSDRKLDPETKCDPNGPVDDEMAIELRTHFGIIPQSSKPTPAQETVQVQTVRGKAAQIPEAPFAFPEDSGMAQIVPVKLFAVASANDSKATFIYAVDEADAKGQYIAMKKIKMETSHRYHLRCEWADAPKVHLATQMKNVDGQQYGNNGYYHILESAEVGKQTVPVVDGQGRQLPQQTFSGAQEVKWTKAVYQPIGRRFAPNAEAVQWNADEFRFEDVKQLASAAA